MRKVLACFAVLLLIGLPGCTGSVPVDHDGDPATPERQMDEAALQRWELSEQHKAERIEAEAKAQADRDIAMAQRDAERAVRRAVTLNEDAVRDIEDSLSDRIDAAASSLARTRLDTTDHAGRIADVAADARAAIAAQSAWVGSVGAIIGDPTTSALAGMIPGGGAILGLAGGIFGLFQKAKAAAATKEVRVATRVIDAIDITKEKDPIFASGFKKNKDTLVSWMGEEGVALVNRLQSERA